MSSSKQSAVSSGKRTTPRSKLILEPLDLLKHTTVQDIVLTKNKSLYSIYQGIVHNNLKHIRTVLENEFPSRWDLKVEPSYAALQMFESLELLHKASTLKQKEEYVQSIMTSTLGYNPPDGLYSVMLRETLVTLIIHFPELHVTNSSNRHHDIQDLYIKMRLTPLFTCSGEYLFTGLRTSMWYAEMGSDYCFSHLSGRTSNAREGSWTGFCLGSTDFSIMCQDMRTRFDKDRFEFLCIQLPDYLSWESIEGRPHRYMKDICERSLFGTSSSSTISSDEITRYVKLILANEPVIPTKLAKGGCIHTVIVNETEEYIDMITKYIDNFNHLNIWDPVSKRESPISHNVKATEVERVRRESRDNRLFTFRGQDVFFKVLDTTTESAPITGPFRIKQGIGRSITSRLNSKFIEYIHHEFAK